MNLWLMGNIPGDTVYVLYHIDADGNFVEDEHFDDMADALLELYASRCACSALEWGLCDEFGFDFDA